MRTLISFVLVVGMLYVFAALFQGSVTYQPTGQYVCSGKVNGNTCEGVLQPLYKWEVR